LVEIQYSSGLLLELRIAGENPTAVLPGPDCISVEPTPDGGTAYLRDDAPGDHFLGQVLAAEPGEG
jgi:hypothetical protein